MNKSLIGVWPSVALMKSITPEKNQQELQEQGSTDFGFAFGDQARFRVSVFRQRGALSLVLRQIPNRLLTFEQIGLPESVQQLLTLHRGLVLVTGPTGSGKSTTLATMIDWINRNRDCHIITIEDPVEYYHTHKKASECEHCKKTYSSVSAQRRHQVRNIKCQLLHEREAREKFHKLLHARGTAEAPSSSGSRPEQEEELSFKFSQLLRKSWGNNAN